MKSFEEVYDNIPGNGWLSKEEASLLWEMVNQTTGDILEVGCYKGRSTCLLAATGRWMYCVDPFSGFDSDDPSGEAILKEWNDNITSRKLSNIFLYRCKIEDWPAYSHRFGFAYLDGDHTSQGTINQIQQALLGRPDTLAIHDYPDPGIRQASNKLLGTPTKVVERLAVWTL